MPNKNSLKDPERHIFGQAGVPVLAGVDEAGRGALAGPVVAAAVVMESLPEGVTDSKRCTPKRREVLAEAIREGEGAWAIGLSSVEEIDAQNILQASLLAMRRAILNLSTTPSQVLVDGLQVPDVAVPCRAIVGGDAKEPLIGAASILAKTHRDALMRRLAEDYPQYGFEQHKGYGTKTHLQALAKFGACPHHRKYFRPVMDASGHRQSIISL